MQVVQRSTSTTPASLSLDHPSLDNEGSLCDLSPPCLRRGGIREADDGVVPMDS